MLITGFNISKEEADKLLTGLSAGTFLLRWSWSEPGELITSFVPPPESTNSAISLVEHCYLLEENEPMDEYHVVEAVIKSRWLSMLLDVCKPDQTPVDKALAFRLPRKTHVTLQNFRK